jgi:glycosyltransferase involved in cell wall biosynthesis
MLFVGRLSEEKGIRPLLEAWTNHDPGLPLVIVGDGPLRDLVAAAVRRLPRLIHWRGHVERHEVVNHLRDALGLVVPSIWYEGMPMCILEALSTGTPVIVSNIGGLPEIVSHNASGLLVEPGDSAGIATAVRQLAKDGGLSRRLQTGARSAYKSRYTPEANYTTLMAIYRAAVKVSREHHASVQ